jgi:photosystem II stability/assembly factor-like uncharacterized protein
MARFTSTTTPRHPSRFLFDALERRLLLTQTYTFANAPITGGGFVDGIEFSPAQQNLVYARTDVGGGYRWSSGTNSWIPLNDALGRNDSQLTGVISLAPDPSNANNVYEAVGQYTESFGQNAAILYSTDQGNTWGRTNLPFRLGGNDDGREAGERLQVDPNKGSILFLGTNNSLWKSTDSGHTWSQVSTFPATAKSLTFVLFDKRSVVAGNATQTMYVGVNTLTGTNLYRTTNGGSTWAAVPNEPTGKLAFQAAIDSAGSLYVTYDNNLGPNNVTVGAVERLNTATGAWTVITPPTGQGGFAGVSVDPSAPGTLIVTTTDRWFPHDQIYRSTDSGAHWTSLWATNTIFDNSSAPWVNLTPHWLDAVAIDPFNSNHAMFGTGFGLYSSTTIKSAAVTWTFTDNGLEETVPLALIAPPGGATLGVAVGDIDGFQFSSVTTVPSTRFTANFGTNNSLDFAENLPSHWVRTFNGSTDGGYSLDDGVTWTTFVSAPPTITAGPGNIAISADGSTMVWMPTNSAAYYSTNNGATWTLSTGGPSNASNTFTPIADRANPAMFYIYDYTVGTVYVSTNGGVSFAASATKLPTGGGTPHAVPGIAGDLWLPTGSGLYHFTAAGFNFTKLTSVQAAYQIGFGKAAPGKTYPAIYLWGQIAGVTGIFRSDDTGATWTRINDDNHQFGWINQLVGDPNVYGRVYLATGGRGVIVATLTPLVGDANLDGQVDLSDLNVVLNNLGQPDTAWADGNFDGAATIDLTDLNDVLNNLGQSTTAPALVATSPVTKARTLPRGGEQLAMFSRHPLRPHSRRRR